LLGVFSEMLVLHPLHLTSRIPIRALYALLSLSRSGLGLPSSYSSPMWL